METFIFVIFLIIIGIALLYWVIISAINDSELVTLLRELNHKMDQLKSNEGIEIIDEEIQTQVKFECPACNTRIPIDCSTCPECGIVFQNE